MSIRPLILKDGVYTIPRSSIDVSALLASIGLNNVNNTSDLSKPISTATQTALDLKANLVSPNLSGTPTTTTATAGTNTTQIANCAFVSTAVSNLIASSPATLDTLNELATALGNDANFSTTVTNSLANKVDLTTNQTINGLKTFSGSLQLPNNAGSTAGTIWRSGDNLEYKDGANVTKILLNSAGNLSNLMNKQIALNNLVNGQIANRVLRSDGTNVTLSQVSLTTDVTNTLPIASGGTGSITQNFVDLTTSQTIAGVKVFSDLTESTNTTTGGTRYLGGVAIAKNLSVGGKIIQAIHYTFKAAASTTQSIPANTWTKITLSSEISDSNNQYTPASSRLTALTAETWQLNTYITLRLTANTRVLLSIWRNGLEVGGTSRQLDIVANTGDYGVGLFWPEFSLAAGDYLEVYCLAVSPITIFGEASLVASFWGGKRIN